MCTDQAQLSRTVKKIDFHYGVVCLILLRPLFAIRLTDVTTDTEESFLILYVFQFCQGLKCVTRLKIKQKTSKK